MNGRPVAGKSRFPVNYSDQHPLKAGSVSKKRGTGMFPVIPPGLVLVEA